ncbi:uncharacterized protein METZ01_LOCUS397677, partial [marine metagenome]
GAAVVPDAEGGQTASAFRCTGRAYRSAASQHGRPGDGRARNARIPVRLRVLPLPVRLLRARSQHGELPDMDRGWGHLLYFASQSFVSVAGGHHNTRRYRWGLSGAGPGRAAVVFPALRPGCPDHDRRHTASRTSGSTVLRHRRWRLGGRRVLAGGEHPLLRPLEIPQAPLPALHRPFRPLYRHPLRLQRGGAPALRLGRGYHFLLRPVLRLGRYCHAGGNEHPAALHPARARSGKYLSVGMRSACCDRLESDGGLSGHSATGGRGRDLCFQPSQFLPPGHRHRPH